MTADVWPLVNREYCWHLTALPGEKLTDGLTEPRSQLRHTLTEPRSQLRHTVTEPRSQLRHTLTEPLRQLRLTVTEPMNPDQTHWLNHGASINTMTETRRHLKNGY